MRVAKPTPGTPRLNGETAVPSALNVRLGPRGSGVPAGVPGGRAHNAVRQLWMTPYCDVVCFASGAITKFGCPGTPARLAMPHPSPHQSRVYEQGPMVS